MSPPPSTEDRSGRRLDRRLLVAVPAGAILGAVAGVVVVALTGGWAPILLLAAAGAATAGTIAAAIEDGRVQREIDEEGRR